jgi:hypothetical protein
MEDTMIRINIEVDTVEDLVKLADKFYTLKRMNEIRTIDELETSLFSENHKEDTAPMELTEEEVKNIDSIKVPF